MFETSSQSQLELDHFIDDVAAVHRAKVSAHVQPNAEKLITVQMDDAPYYILFSSFWVVQQIF